MGFDISTRSVGYRTLVALLQADPVLSREVRTWNTWEGDPTDPSALSDSQLPYLQLTPRTEAAVWMDTGSIRTPILVDVTLAVSGTRIDDGLDAWGAIESCVLTYASQLALIAAGASEFDLVVPSFAVANRGGAVVLVGRGGIRLVFYAGANTGRTFPEAHAFSSAFDSAFN